MSVYDGPNFLPKADKSAAHEETKHHPVYDRVYEAWRLSCEEGARSLRELVASPTEPLHISLDRLVEVLGDAQRDASDFGTWVFREAATLLAEIKPDASYIDNNDFSHTAKYLFVGSCFSSGARSVLDDPQSRVVAARLVNLAVDFCERSQSLGTMPLLIKGIIASNMREWAQSGDVSRFSCKPPSLSSPQFVALIRHAGELEAQKVSDSSKPVTRSIPLIERFITATSPTEFLLWAFSQGTPLPVPEVISDVRKALLKSLGDQAESYPFLAEPDERGTAAQESLDRRAKLELREGVYVDVFGTLINHDGSPNYRLAQVITDLMDQEHPREVFLVSDSQDEEIERALKFLRRLPPIVHKDRLEGCELEYLVDNSEPGPQGFRARSYFAPDRIAELLEALRERGRDRRS